MNSNRSFKDSLFTSYFSDGKRAIEVYNAVTGADYPDTAEIEFNTLESVLIGAQRNDLSFTLDGKLVILIEHQSTVNRNMPLRLLLYMSRVYEKIVDRRALYRERLERIPRPEFIVFYNGRDDCPDKETLRLSDAYMVEGDPELELVVDVYNIAEGHNGKLLARSKALSDYSSFVAIVTKYEAGGLSRDEAIEKAVYNCVRNGIMSTYLEAQGAEVINMLITEFDMDEYVEVVREEYREIGREEGIEEGIVKGVDKGRVGERLDIARNMKSEKYDAAAISKVTGLSVDEIEGIEV